ncbi:hypothetical protein [Polyangium aurulentum]|uniref:hypothetical protein n=1 Tax=Polyangium aurulentum TaxID=2567896 RepID=UPI0010AEA3BD|nr:hypothetical protein [Polyangium aurulentum]UQA56052.1 hypothetical protein E8A73_032685 [Polyangium aurulentum]
MPPARSSSAALLLLALALPACDDKASEKGAPSAGPSAAAAPTVAAAPTAAPTVEPPRKIDMPPRPVPIGSSGPIQPSAPPDIQMMAIQYTIAMVTPRGGEPLVDKDYVERMVKKLEVAVRTADKGKTPPNPVKPDKGNRKLVVDMGKGCTEKTPENLLHQRAGSSLKEAYEAGVLVVSCHDDKWECHQSTRIPEDVLCHAAPRH